MKVCVIGAGPAGLMASLQASQNHDVIVVDSQPHVGTKLLMTGHGRCNVTNNRSVHDFLSHCSKSSTFMYSSLTEFGPREIIAFFERQGVPLRQEDDYRMFPSSNKAEDILGALLKDNRSMLKLNSPVRSIHLDGNKMMSVETRHEVIEADHFILCTGGKTFPSTGSDGSGYKLAKRCGHTITKLAGVEVGLRTPNTEPLMGVSLSARVQVLVNQKVMFDEVGELLFAHFGLSGPVILKASEWVVDGLEQEKESVVRIHLGDPDLKRGSLKKELSRFAPKRMVDYLLSQPGEVSPLGQLTPWLDISHLEQISNAEKEKIVNALFRLDFPISGTLPIEKAFVTKGGVKTNEVDPKTMRSKLVDNLSFCGEILDIHGMLGGFNITLALSSGYTAGSRVS